MRARKLALGHAKDFDCARNKYSDQPYFKVRARGNGGGGDGHEVRRVNEMGSRKRFETVTLRN